MSLFIRLRGAALSALLAVSPALQAIADPAPVQPAELTADALMAELDKRPASSTRNLDVEDLNAALGGKVRLGYDFATQENPTAPTRLTGVRFEILGDDTMTLFTADELLIWNADTPGLIARLSGERLGESIRLFDRLELSGVKLDLTDYTNAVDDAVTAALPETGTDAPNISYEAAEANIGRMVFDGLTLHPWTHKAVAGEDTGLAAIRLLSAVARGFSLETAAFVDTTMSQSMTEGGASGTFQTRYPAQVWKGYDRGDIAAMVQSGATFSGSVPMPAPADAEDPATAAFAGATLFEMSGKLDHGSWNGLRLAKLLEYGERGELPPITERDLWSLGTYSLAGMSMNFGDKPIVEVGRVDISVDQFAWFMPEHILVKHEDVAFDMAALMNWAAEIEPEAMQSAPGEPGLTDILGIMERTGLGRLSGDGTLLLSWDSNTGKALIEGTSVSDGLYADDTRFEVTLPTYADLVPAFGVDGRSPDTELLGDLFGTKFAFHGGHYSLTDTGLLDAIAKLTIEIARFSGESDPTLSNFADSTPEAVRMFASGMLMFGGGAVSRDVPQATDWIASLSSFITSGGTFSVKLAPDQALTLADFTPDPEAGMVEAPGPAELVSLFGLSMSHTPPPAPVAAGTP